MKRTEDRKRAVHKALMILLMLSLVGLLIILEFPLKIVNEIDDKVSLSLD